MKMPSFESNDPNAASLDEVLWRHAEEAVGAAGVDWDRLRGSCIAITGATGLVCSQFARVLACASERFDLGVRLALLVRDPKKAARLFGGFEPNARAGQPTTIDFIPWRLGERLPEGLKPDFCVHGASATASAAFRDRPVEVMVDIASGCQALLDGLRGTGARFVFLSSMEVYGAPQGTDRAEWVAREDELGFIDPLSPRSCYPEAKRFCECLCACYAKEHDVSTVVVRLAQTFGAGVSASDQRAFAEFGRNALQGADVTLKTPGTKRNPYVAVDDAATALATVMLAGEPGQAYNVANPATVCSVKEMAQLALDEFGALDATVRVELDADAARLYPPATALQLDTSKIEALGWLPRHSLRDMFAQMVEGWQAAEEAGAQDV